MALVSTPQRAFQIPLSGWALLRERNYLVLMPESIFLEPLIDREELARRLGVTCSCVRKWQEIRAIPFYKLGRRCVRFDFREVLAVLSKNKTTNSRRVKPRRLRTGPPPPRWKQGEFFFVDASQPELFTLGPPSVNGRQ